MLLACLWWLAEQEHDPPTQGRLAEQAGTDPMMTSQVLRKLEGRGLLERVADRKDTRARRLHLTQAGRTLVARALADVERADGEYFGPLGNRLDRFLHALAALTG